MADGDDLGNIVPYAVDDAVVAEGDLADVVSPAHPHLHVLHVLHG